MLSDGDPALPRLVRGANGADVRHILDWWHISMRIRHVETTFQTLFSLMVDPVGLEVETLVQNLRWPPQGSHRVATVRAAVLDGRLGEGQLRAA